MNKCEKNVRSFTYCTERANKFKITALVLAVTILVQVFFTSCVFSDYSADSNNLNTFTKEETIPAKSAKINFQNLDLSQRLLSESEIQAYTDELRDCDIDFSKRRPGKNIKLSDLKRVQILRVVDGDTLKIKINGENERLRLIGIDAPESFSHHDEAQHTVAGENVSRIVEDLLKDISYVYLQFDQEDYDQYERLLAYVYINEDVMLNELLARYGLVDVKCYPPNLYYHEYLLSLESAAKKEGLGIWHNEYKNNNSFSEGEKLMNNKTIYLAGGCFWGVEAYYQRLEDAVINTTVGYANGKTKNPDYYEVCRGGTEYAETLKLEYDADKISLREILAHFFRIIDPTTSDRQGNDIGSQYRPGIYYVNVEDKAEIEDYIEARQKDYNQAIVVEVEPLKNFYDAEEYHQDYLVKNPSGYCHVNPGLADLPLTDEELALP